MKVGIAAHQEERDFNPSHEFPPKDAVLYEVDLPEEITRGLELIDSHLPIGGTPIMTQSLQGHNHDYGLVFRIGDYSSVNLIPEGLCTSFSRKGLVARVSMGMPESIETRNGSELVLKDPTQLTRLHLNVYGARNFLPPEEERVTEDNQFNYATEEIHFSLRWVNGVFDNRWNNPSIWISEKDDRSLGKPEFDDMRTTYCQSGSRRNGLNRHFRHNHSGVKQEYFDRSIGPVIGLEEVERMIGTNRERILPANASLDEFMKIFPNGTSSEDAMGVSYPNRRPESFPHIGYSPALNTLSKFGDVSPAEAENIPNLSMSEGIEYIFGKVLPAMRNFTEA